MKRLELRKTTVTTLCAVFSHHHSKKYHKISVDNELNYGYNDPVDLSLENEKIIIKKIDQKDHKTIKQRLIEFYGNDYEKHSAPQNEIDWGNPVGNEI